MNKLEKLYKKRKKLEDELSEVERAIDAELEERREALIIADISAPIVKRKQTFNL